jgi:hypothetical protein
MATMATSQVVVNRRTIAGASVTALRTGGYGEASYIYRRTGEELTQQLDYIRVLSISEEAKASITNSFLEGYALDVVSAIKAQGVPLVDVDLMIKPVLRSVMTGPVDQRVKADGTPNEALRLYNTQGGEALLDQIVAKANASQIQANTQQAQN